MNLKNIKWKKADLKDYLLNDSTYVKFLERCKTEEAENSRAWAEGVSEID